MVWKELLNGLGGLTTREILLDIHGGLAMLSMIFYGGLIATSIYWKKYQTLIDAIKKLWIWQIVVVGALYILGLLMYIPYRAKGGAKSTLVGNETTVWLHKIVFEHKELLALAPLILAIVAYWVVNKIGTDSNQKQLVRRISLFCAVAGLLTLLLVATEAVLVTKVAPVK